MEGAEMQRHVGSEIRLDPLALGRISSSESFFPGINSVVISVQTCVSLTR
jgi:hypothetical protein